MAEQSLVYNSDGSVSLVADTIENKLAELFNDRYYTVNLETGEFGFIDMNYFFAKSIEDINKVAFDAEEVKKLPETEDSDTIYVVGYDIENPLHTIIEPVSVIVLTELVENAYKSRTFIGHDVYWLLRNIANRVCEKYFPSHKIFRELLERTNSVMFKDGKAVIAVTENRDSFTRFYETVMSVESCVKPSLLLNFGSTDYASVYTKASNELFGLKPDEQITAFQNSNALKDIVYELCITKPEMENVIIISMVSDGRYFIISSVETSSDYRGIKGIIDANYNDSEKIISDIMEYNISSHMEDLLALID